MIRYDSVIAAES